MIQWKKAVRSLPLQALCLLGVALPAVQASAADTYKVVDKWTIGGTTGWDYLLADSVNHVLYVTHGTELDVLDLNNGNVLQRITGFKGLHGVALDPENKYAYISDGGANAVVVLDRHSYAKVSSIAAGTNPDGIAYEPVTRTVWALNGRSQDATVIDATTQQVVATVKVPGKPEAPEVDGKGSVYINIETKNELVRVDAKTRAVTGEWPLKGCESPSGLAVDSVHRRVYSVCDSKVMIATDADTGTLVKQIPIGNGPDASEVDAKNNLVFSPNGEDGTLTVISTTDLAVRQTVKTQTSGRTLAFDASTGRIFVTVAQMGPRPAATTENPRPRPAIVPGSFAVLVIAKQ
ncbi:MAG: YncE family protein [Acidobacteriota bacterium]|nr:YncE family protein [Acidobacteriota bacterium]